MEGQKQLSPLIENKSRQVIGKNKGKNVLRLVRIGVQVVFLFWMPSLFAQAFGGVKEILTDMGAGRGLHLSAFVVTFLILCGITIVFGRIFCGWMCAFGALGDWIYQFSSFIQKKNEQEPAGNPSQMAAHSAKNEISCAGSHIIALFYGEK